jgi:predicted ATPase
VRLLADIAQGRIIQSLAVEGGLHSTLWAGPESFSRATKRGEQPVQGTVRKASVSLKLGFAGKDYGYAIDLGLPTPSSSHFARDPVIKVESQWVGETLSRSNAFATRNGPSARVRDDTGARHQVATHLAPLDSMMTHCSDPRDAPELTARPNARLAVLRSFPYRPRCAGAKAAGRDLYAGARKRRIGPSRRDANHSRDRRSGRAYRSDWRRVSRMHDRNLQQRRVFRIANATTWALASVEGAELSDGTLRYLLLIAALLSPRPPDLMILNEPETSLHPDLLPPLARLIAQAARRTQVIVVSHAAPLVSALAEDPQAQQILLEKQLGETLIQPDERASWAWPTR